jgi:hypothetical protein
MISIFVDLLHLGGDPCRSVGDQPPLPAPRGDPARLGTLSADPPLVVLLYSSCAPPPLRIILFSLSVTQGGAGSPPPLVEVNQAILAWSFYHCPTLERLLDVDHHEAVLVLLDLIVDVQGNGAFMFYIITTVLPWRDFWM